MKKHPFREMTTEIEIHLNGDVTQLKQGTSLSGLIEGLGINLKQVAIELNREIIPRSELGSVELQAGDAVEIVSFIGGG